ncbi:DUF3592 domain-containing protein [Yoonia sp. SS1-5]|uniref:DUF3592 domain-containing protein n=1 Tax=Yoonia rhodophyticola TaxID=3137370 RepID=A0AAN0MCX6_9RHOB
MSKLKLTEPRSWFSLFLAHYGWAAMIAGLALLGLTIASTYNYRVGAEFARAGQSITAEVVDRDIEVDDGDKSYYLTFRFTPKGRVYAIRKKVGERYYNRHELGSSAEIYYLPRKPAIIQTYQGEYRNDGILLQVFALIAGVAACVGLVWSGGYANSAVKARRYGARIAAEVVSQEVVRDRHGDDSGDRRLIWRDADGRRGRSLPHGKAYLKSWPAGATIHVYRGPKRSWWEGDVGPRAPHPRPVPRVDQ